MRILIIGSSGFVGQNLYEDLESDFEVYGCFRSQPLENKKSIYFDFADENSWQNVVSLQPDVIINAGGYGVVKLQQDLETMYRINYLLPVLFVDYIQKHLKFRLIQIGSAFEYDLSVGRLTEASCCRPLTHYGISKFMMAQYLLNSAYDNFTVIRPFGMFGPYEHESKFFPALIAAQRDKKQIDLSSGEQVRDYFFVKDLTSFIRKLLKDRKSLPKIINVGSNQEHTIKVLADQLASLIPHFSPIYWRWGVMKSRVNESTIFVNQSQLATDFGLLLTDFNTAFKYTINYYFNGSNATEI